MFKIGDRFRLVDATGYEIFTNGNGSTGTVVEAHNRDYLVVQMDIDVAGRPIGIYGVRLEHLKPTMRISV